MKQSGSIASLKKRNKKLLAFLRHKSKGFWFFFSKKDISAFPSPAALKDLLVNAPASAAPWVRAAAEHGMAAAQVRLGRMLLEGTGLPRDQAASLRWFATAARDGDIDAMNMVGRCHENGWGTAPDAAQAAIWYERAATRGDAWAQYNLGHLLLDGNGVARDRQAAFTWYSRAAAQGHARAMNLVGRCYEEGWGTPADPVRAAAAYRISAEAGYFRGQFNHATLLLAAGRRTEARAWLARAAETAPAATGAVIARVQAALDARRWPAPLMSGHCAAPWPQPRVDRY